MYDTYTHNRRNRLLICVYNSYRDADRDNWIILLFAFFVLILHAQKKTYNIFIILQNVIYTFWHRKRTGLLLFT